MNDKNALTTTEVDDSRQLPSQIQEQPRMIPNEELSIYKFQQASMLKLEKEEEEVLSASVPEEDIDIRPDGLIYYSHVYVRERLNKGVGIGQWILAEEWVKERDNTIMFKGSLYVRGHYIGTAIGEMEYHPNNPMQSYASVYEGAKSDCLVRCCKDLGIGKECWQRSFSSNWVMKYGVKVWRDKARHGKGEYQWRHVNSQPFWDEASVAQDSPNQPKFTKGNKNSGQGINKPKQTKQNLGTAFQPLTDEEVTKKLKAETSLNNLRVLFDQVSKTNAEQADRFRNAFNKRREELIAAREAEKAKPKDEPPAQPEQRTDLVEAMIDNLTKETFERGDWKSLEVLISSIRNASMQKKLIAVYEAKLKAWKVNHKPNIIRAK